MLITAALQQILALESSSLNPELVLFLFLLAASLLKLEASLNYHCAVPEKMYWKIKQTAAP